LRESRLKTALQSLIIVSAVAILCGCKTTKQNYEIVRTEDLNLTNTKRFDWVINSYEKYRKVSLVNWECYVPDENTEETFFCAYKSEIATLISGLSMPPPPDSNNENHPHQDGDDHPHHD
jgi:hypothetical protein